MDEELVTQVDLADDELGMAVAGDVDMDSSPAVAEAIQRAIASRPRRLTVDLARVTFLDSSGIRVLLLGRDQAAEQGVAFRVIDPQPVVRRVLDLAGVLDLLTEGS